MINLRAAPSLHIHQYGERDLSVHKEKVQFLATLAMLIGCWETIGGIFPDGRHPDVLRINSPRRLLFIGDAKHTESPGNSATRARLQEYLQWLSAHVKRQPTSGIFAICFSNEIDTDQWVETVFLLGCIAGLSFHDYDVELFEHDLRVAWFVA